MTCVLNHRKSQNQTQINCFLQKNKERKKKKKRPPTPPRDGSTNGFFLQRNVTRNRAAVEVKKTKKNNIYRVFRPIGGVFSSENVCKLTFY